MIQKKKTNRFSIVLSLFFLLFTFSIQNCSSMENAEKGRLLKLTFDGQGCVYKGPTVLTPGPVTLVFVNKSDGLAGANFTIHSEGKTIQDMIDYIGEEPSTRRRPFWARELGTMEAVEAGETYIWEGVLEAGTYTIVGARLSRSLAVWFGTGLIVEE